jgi:NAD(P)-dependent dehydrogenase (short-subunit alcohol dehydrogenase family)
MLGEAGATVYCTGRSSRVQPNVSSHVHAGRPETIEETAEMVTAGGGTGIPVRVDHTAEDQVVALFERVEREQSRLDVLAIVITGQPASWKSFLEETPAEGKAFVEGWIWPHVVTAWHGAKLMVRQSAGLIVELVEQDNVGYHGAFYFDMMETLLKRLVLGLANDLGKSGVTAVAVAPGFMRTEAILEGFGVAEANWRDALGNPQAGAMGWGGSETPCFVGRAVAALAADPHVGRKNGGIYTTRALSEEYGFNDVDGLRPDYAVLDAAVEQAKKTFMAPMVEAGRFTEVEWKLASKPGKPS